MGGQVLREGLGRNGKEGGVYTLGGGMVSPRDWPEERSFLIDPQVRATRSLFLEASSLPACPCLSLGPHHLTSPESPESPVACVTYPPTHQGYQAAPTPWAPSKARLLQGFPWAQGGPQANLTLSRAEWGW